MTYKLKKWYPGLPKNWEVGQIVKPDTSFKFQNKLVHYIDEKGNMVGAKQVENNPEYWEEVKDYEILKVRGIYSSEIKEYKEGVDLDLHNIHSVKRLSDGEVFTVGDKTNAGNLTGFSIDSRNKAITHHNPSGEDLNDDYYLEGLEHRKEPLFTTEDGVDIYKGDQYYCVTFDFCVNRSKGGSTKSHTTLARFSSINNAEQYIKDNKPKYSKSDIEEAIKYANMASGEIHEGSLKRALKL